MEESLDFTLGQKVSHFSTVLQGNLEDLEMCLMWVWKDILTPTGTGGQVNVAQQRHMSAGSVPKVLRTQEFSVVGHFGHPDLITLVWLH